LAQNGPKLLQARSAATALRTFLRQFISSIVLILLVATITSAVLGDWIDTATIPVMILGSVTLSFVQE
jgi:magnesium-transporting ATPase (P-type)